MDISEKIIGGTRLSRKDALELAKTAPLDEICALAEKYDALPMRCASISSDAKSTPVR